ncbi:hypothetical protein P171DRAFT_430528 [Karstenula rhodostoma CBS 690.94]|uniref:F-box domain-containing protein n=1 Tax=Karstenula rhodostoma CBS 690.94 TaxID=1392251 RepID=A0A9P4PNZ2_9PLEO|nr:hypothetical protein P171DRAFT_430528 [Karstenula rhodostoma CBS 690.94]
MERRAADLRLETETLEMRVREARSDHHRLFLEIQRVWKELHSWGKALELNTLSIHIGGESLYDLLGPEMRWEDEFHTHIVSDGWLRSCTELPLEELVSVTSLIVTASEDIDIWPAIVGCIIAETLPNLEHLRLFSSDWQKRWTLLRSELRDVLAQHIKNLSRKSLQTFELRLPFKYSMNHDVHPPSLHQNGEDILSKSLHTLLTNLVTLSINVNQLTPTLFWDPSIRTSGVLCPNLKSLHVDSGFETACGQYIMRRPDNLLFSRPAYMEDEDEDLLYPDSELGIPDPDVQLDYELGDYPTAITRVRPKPVYFDELSISVAQAATHMPRLQSITIEFVSHFTDRGDWTGYHGWGFAFRAGAEARYPETHTHAWCGYPGLDMYILESPRREWTFRCELDQVGWEEPDEAKRLWEERFPGILADIICFDFDEDGQDCWQGVWSDVAIRPEEIEMH